MAALTSFLSSLVSDPFAYSFPYAVIKVNGRQFTAINSISITQDLEEGAVYGTDSRPLKRSVGQIKMGQGRLSFSDFDQARDFFASLGPQPLMAIFNLDYQLTKPDGSSIAIECVSCRLTSISFEHNAGPEPLGATFPFSFLTLRVDGVESLLTRIFQAIF